MTTYNDWQVTLKHAEVVNELLPAGLRAGQIWVKIPGIYNGKFSPKSDFRAGVYFMPLKSSTGREFSASHDVARTTLMVAATGRSSRQSDSTPILMELSESIRNTFASRRITGFDRELYSTHSFAEYDVDDAAEREYDIIFAHLVTRLREDRHPA